MTVTPERRAQIIQEVLDANPLPAKVEDLHPGTRREIEIHAMNAGMAPQEYLDGMHASRKADREKSQQIQAEVDHVLARRRAGLQ